MVLLDNGVNNNYFLKENKEESEFIQVVGLHWMYLFQLYKCQYRTNRRWLYLGITIVHNDFQPSTRSSSTS